MKRHLLPIVVLTLSIALGGTDPQAAEASDNAKPSVTVFPVATTPEKLPDEFARRVGIVVATFLEKAGLEDLEVSDTMFNPPETDDVDKIAEAFGKQLSGKPVETDYAVFGSKVHYVHVIVCDRSGDWVLIDMQNSHHLDFERIDPKSAADCNRLLLSRLKNLLSG